MRRPAGSRGRNRGGRAREMSAAALHLAGGVEDEMGEESGRSPGAASAGTRPAPGRRERAPARPRARGPAFLIAGLADARAASALDPTIADGVDDMMDHGRQVIERLVEFRHVAVGDPDEQDEEDQPGQRSAAPSVQAESSRCRGSRGNKANAFERARPRDMEGHNDEDEADPQGDAVGHHTRRGCRCRAAKGTRRGEPQDERGQRDQGQEHPTLKKTRAAAQAPRRGASFGPSAARGSAFPGEKLRFQPRISCLNFRFHARWACLSWKVFIPW